MEKNIIGVIVIVGVFFCFAKTEEVKFNFDGENFKKEQITSPEVVDLNKIKIDKIESSIKVENLSKKIYLFGDVLKTLPFESKAEFYKNLLVEDGEIVSYDLSLLSKYYKDSQLELIKQILGNVNKNLSNEFKKSDIFDLLNQEKAVEFLDSFQVRNGKIVGITKIKMLSYELIEEEIYKIVEYYTGKINQKALCLPSEDYCRYTICSNDRCVSNNEDGYCPESICKK